MINVKFEIMPSGSIEHLEVWVKEVPGMDSFRVFVNGGMLSNEQQAFLTKDLWEALQTAVHEINVALNGGL